MRISNALIAASLAALLGSAPAFVRSAAASDTVGFDYMTGQGYRGFDLKGSLDLGAKKDWTGRGSVAAAHDTAGTESKTRQGSLGLSHVVDEHWDVRGSLSGWKDTVSNVSYIGPSFGFTYTVLKEAAPDKKNETGPTDDRPPPEPEDVLGISFDCDFFTYSTDIVASTRAVVVAGVHKVLPPSSTRLSVRQLHPNITIDAPLDDGDVTPMVSLGHYIYSRDPNAIEQIAGRPRLAASAGSLNALVGGFFRNNASMSVDILLPAHSLLRAALGAEQLATDRSWATTQEIMLQHTFADRVKARVDWSRSIQSGLRQDIYTLGAIYLF